MSSLSASCRRRNELLDVEYTAAPAIAAFGDERQMNYGAQKAQRRAHVCSDFFSIAHH